MRLIRYSLFFVFCLLAGYVQAQPGQSVNWSSDGQSFYQLNENNIEAFQLKDSKQSVKITAAQLTPAAGKPLAVKDFSFSADEKKLLIYTNAKKVWRYDTRGDYWILDLTSNTLKQLGKDLPASSLMFAKLSPNGLQVAYVSGHNLYVEEVATGKRTALTQDGTRRLINGTF